MKYNYKISTLHTYSISDFNNYLKTIPQICLLTYGESSLTVYKNIKDTLHAYQLAKRCNVKRVMGCAVKQGEKGARINSISSGIVVTPLAIDEFNGPRGDFYKNMFAKCPARRPATADEVANVAELLMSPKGAFITGSDFLIDGGATASYFYGALKSEKQNINY